MLSLLFAFGCAPKIAPVPQVSAEPALEPPVAERRPHALEAHGETRDDPYYWLRDREDPATLAYLEAENAYALLATAHTAALRETIYGEMLGRVQEADAHPPAAWGDWWYYERTEEGRAYPILCRRDSPGGSEQIVLDFNAVAGDGDYLAVGAIAPSPDHRLLAYAVDTSGDELFTVRVLDLETGEHLPDVIEDAYYGLEWSGRDALFYTTVDDAYRPYRLHRRALGGDGGDTLVYEESDEAFWLDLSRTRSGRFLVVSLGSNTTTEVRVLELGDAVEGPLEVVLERTPGVEYSLAHRGDTFYLAINEDAVNFKLVAAPVGDAGRESWTEVLPHRPAIQIVSVDAFADHLVIYEREDGLPQITVWDAASGEARRVAFPEQAWSVYADYSELTDADLNRVYDTASYRYVYTSMSTPESVFSLDLETLETALLKETPVLGGFDRTQYRTERITAVSADGTEVPVSLVYRADLRDEVDGNPALMVGYGAYGSDYDVYFSANRLSLLDRGVIYAIAHVRGGSDLGRPWYEDGKLLNKKHTFEDFVASGEALVAGGWTRPERLAVSGGSAGGLLIGASVNMRPELFAAAVADVPFVDVLTTMSDPTIPLTVTEWEEWGNPSERRYYDYMKSYSPYDNVAAVDYPDMLIQAGLNDPRVGYWEPAKWAAKLRHTATGGEVLLWTEMGAGHAGPSGRYGYLEAIAREWAFVLDKTGGAQPVP